MHVFLLAVEKVQDRVTLAPIKSTHIGFWQLEGFDFIPINLVRELLKITIILFVDTFGLEYNLAGD